MSFNFKGTEEKASSNFNYVGTGIHDFKVEKIYYQPVGASVNDEKKKDGSPVEFSLEQVRVQLKCVRTHAGKDSKDATTVIGILSPKPDKVKEGLQRIFHIFCNMTTADKKENAKAYMEKINESTFKGFTDKLKPFVGKEVRYKLIADQNGKYAILPNYYGGFAEPVDVPFTSSTLRYDDAKEGIKTKPTNAETPSSEAEFAPAPRETDDLPF
jgi:hypothetical protein